MNLLVFLFINRLRTYMYIYPVECVNIKRKYYLTTLRTKLNIYFSTIAIAKDIFLHLNASTKYHL